MVPHPTNIEGGNTVGPQPPPPHLLPPPHPSAPARTLMRRAHCQTSAWQKKRTPHVYAELPPPPPEFVVVKAASKPKE